MLQKKCDKSVENVVCVDLSGAFAIQLMICVCVHLVPGGYRLHRRDDLIEQLPTFRCSHVCETVHGV